MNKTWKKGRGKLGFLTPLLGSWTAEADSAMGRVRCRRSFTEVLNGSCIRVDVRWEFLGGAGAGQWAGKTYEELAMMGVGDDRNVWFWSFTSDGKRSQGFQSDVTELHAEAVGFEADMPAGRARFAYWPDGPDGFVWVVESRGKKGWKRFTEHRYRRDNV